MDADKPKNEQPLFEVENNVYKGPTSPYSGTYKSIGEMVWKKINGFSDKIAQFDARTKETVTYKELQKKIAKCALWLQEQGIKPDDVVSVCTHNHVNALVPCLAATYVNAIFNPWDEEMNLPTALHVLQLTTPKIIFCNENSTNVVLQAIHETKCSPKVVVFGSHPKTISFASILSGYSDAQAAHFRYVENDNMKKAVCILHSSGTTGMPKGVEMSNYAMLSMNADSVIDLNEMVSLWFSSLYWISGTILSLKAISQGAKIIIYPEFDEEMTCILIEKYKVTWLFIGTSMTNRLIKAGYVKNYSLLSLKMIFCGGAILHQETQRDLKHILPHVEILQGYGMTEIGGIATCQNSYHKAGSCGIPVLNVQLKIADSNSGKALGPNQMGEAWLKSNNIMNGYYRNPEATRSTIDEEGWLHSGDLCYIDEDGELFVIDRLKDLIKYRGHQISPAEVETVLLTHPAILEVAVVAVPHPTDDEHPIAYATKKPGAEVTEKEIINFVANNMMDHFKLRAGVVFLDTFPYTGSGKIAKKELKAMAKKLAVQ
ncbi:PREDICTED: 4-coumarate--CoA ligase 1-like [Dinoponera quadriceps]|uniref:4-coumarate--CoA ligase 1-like n=1 Tax=Dinoponera quadriceps TaxID=609295 RepID=A0A6P3YAF5_DINQU|nr:PREDICTED: 4-coumarate--CoA ligase 1-like [Dinoponera quadriceps]XP_014487960.1 PREDICTED: 4-coumarate--CoA ligase 1-like [Dinoponera quadriceps]